MTGIRLEIWVVIERDVEGKETGGATESRESPRGAATLGRLEKGCGIALDTFDPRGADLRVHSVLEEEAMQSLVAVLSTFVFCWISSSFLFLDVVVVVDDKVVLILLGSVTEIISSCSWRNGSFAMVSAASPLRLRPIPPV